LRVPLLDHKVLEFGASLPSDLKVRGLTTKYLLKRTLKRRVPLAIINRKKTGFPVPYESWLRHEHRDDVRSILRDSKSGGRGYFSRPAIETLLAENDSHGRYGKEIFALVTLELWHRTFIDGHASLQ
jgi:asparagine synthase (glutamine-hydrolysing)